MKFETVRRGSLGRMLTYTFLLTIVAGDFISAHAANIFDEDAPPTKLAPPAPLPGNQPTAADSPAIPLPTTRPQASQWLPTLSSAPLILVPPEPPTLGVQAPASITAQRTLVLPNGDQLLYLSAEFDPSLHVSAWESLRIDSATEDTGAAALIQNTVVYASPAQAGHASWQLHLQTSPAAKSLASIKGFATFLNTTETQMLEVKNLKNLTGEKIVCGNVEIALTYVQRATDFGIQVDTHCPAGIDLDKFKVFNRLALNATKLVTDSHGVKLMNYSSSGSYRNEGAHNVYYYKIPQNGAAGEGAQLTWDIPTKVTRIDKAFELKNVALRQQVISGSPAPIRLPAEVTLRHLPASGSVPVGAQPTPLSASRRFTFHLKSATPQLAFLELGRQSGLKFEPDQSDVWSRIATRSINLDVENVPYWEAARPIFLQARTMPLYAPDGRVIMGILNAERTWDREPFSVSGPVLISTPLVFVMPPFTPAASLQFTALIEPTRTGLSWETLQVESAIDDTGAAIAVIPTKKKLHFSVQNGTARQDVTLQPSPKARRIAGIKGTASFLIRESAEVLKIDNLPTARGIKVTIGGMDFEVNYRPTLEGCNIDIIIRPGSKSPEDFRFLVQEALFVLPAVADSQGRALYYRTRSASEITENGVRIIMGFHRTIAGLPANDRNAAGLASTFTWTIPTSISRCETPFEIKNVPIQVKSLNQ